MSTVLEFPTRDKGRKRKRQSPDAMGRCSIGMLARRGGAIPENIADIRQAKAEPSIDDGALALRLSASIFAMLDDSQKEAIRGIIRSEALHHDGRAGDECRALYRLLTGERF